MLFVSAQCSFLALALYSMLPPEIPPSLTAASFRGPIFASQLVQISGGDDQEDMYAYLILLIKRKTQEQVVEDLEAFYKRKEARGVVRS